MSAIPFFTKQLECSIGFSTRVVLLSYGPNGLSHHSLFPVSVRIISTI